MRRIAARPRSDLFAALARGVAAALALAAVAIPGTPDARAQSGFGAVAKVNDEVVTNYDIQQRMALLRVIAGSTPPPNLDRLALNELVADELKLQTAERQGVSLRAGALEQALERIASSNQAPSVEAFLSELERQGVERGTLEKKVRSDLVWQEVIRRRFGERMRPTAAEVDAAMTDAQAADRIFDLMQIVVELAPTAPESAVLKAAAEAMRVKERMTDCATTTELAKEYGRISGAIGKVRSQEMPGPVRDAVQTLEVGDTTDPMRSQQGFHVVILCGSEVSNQADRDRIVNQLTEQKAARLADSYLDDIRRTAMIETR